MSARRLLEGERHEFGVDDPRYPEMLRRAPDHPEKLYVLGNADVLSRPSVSIIGARKATPYGVSCARMAAKAAVGMGIQVVSGAAMGCDHAAQGQALEDRGSTVAVLGCGADVVYPESSRKLLQGILAGGGAIVSERPWGTPPAKWTFISRNAVIASLSACLVICEAGMPSGTFSTAKFATEFGKEVLVFPGSVFSPNSTGCNYIIASQPQAMPIWDRECLELAFSRIYGALRYAQSPTVSRPCEESEESLSILAALQASPSTPADLAFTFGLETMEVARLLAGFEIDGRVVRLRDGRYSLSEREYLSHNSYRT